MEFYEWVICERVRIISCYVGVPIEDLHGIQ